MNGFHGCRLYEDLANEAIMSIKSETIKHKIAVYVAMIGCALAVMVSPAVSADPQSLQTGLTTTILSLEKTRKVVIEQQLSAAGWAKPAYSREEALLFVAYLEGRINHYCKALYLSGGPQSLEGLPCGSPTQLMAGDPRFESVPDFSGQTSGEKVARLEEEFTAALGEFDEMLLQEQEKVAAHIPRQREDGGGGQGGQPGQSGGPETTTGSTSGELEQAPGGTDIESDSRQTGGGPEQGATNEGAGQGSAESSRVPPSQGSRELSEDDDVVARQLREAAEQETDPEVKEKLWEEYRKYKEGTQ